MIILIKGFENGLVNIIYSADSCDIAAMAEMYF